MDLLEFLTFLIAAVFFLGLRKAFCRLWFFSAGFQELLRWLASALEWFWWQRGWNQSVRFGGPYLLGMSLIGSNTTMRENVSFDSIEGHWSCLLHHTSYRGPKRVKNLRWEDFHVCNFKDFRWYYVLWISGSIIDEHAFFHVGGSMKV